MALSDHVDSLDGGDCCCGPMEYFEACHRVGNPLYETVVLLENVVEIFDRSDPDLTPAVGKFQDDVHRLKPSEIGTALVDNNALRHPIRADRLLEETSSGNEIAALEKHEIKGFSVAVDGTIEVSPANLDLDVGLIRSPRVGCRLLPPLRVLDDQWCKLDNPSVQRRMVDLDPALSHDLLKVSVRDGIADIEEHRKHNHRFRVVNAYEIKRVELIVGGLFGFMTYPLLLSIGNACLGDPGVSAHIHGPTQFPDHWPMAQGSLMGR